MPTYITPRILINQEFTQSPVFSAMPLPAFIVGPQYALTRYSVAAEKAFTALGTIDGNAVETGNLYDPTADTRFDFPNVPVGGIVDHSYTKVFAEAVQAQYFPLEALGDPGVGGDSVELVASISGQPHTNKIRFINTTLKTANGFDRSPVLSNRDVAVGDYIEVSDNLGNTVTGRIKALEAETAATDVSLASQEAPIIAAGTDGVVASPHTSNLVSASSSFVASEVVGQYLTVAGVGVRKILASPSPTVLTVDAPLPTGVGRTFYVGGVYNDVSNTPYATENYNGSVVLVSGDASHVAVANTSSAYKGYAAKGILHDVYVVTVVSGSTLADVQFSVASTSGAFAVKTLGLALGDVLNLDTANNNNLTLDFTGSTAFVLGTTWSLTVAAPVTQVVPAVSGNYVGSVDMVYRLYVERGGAFFDGTNAASCARLLITSSDVDSSTLVLPQASTAFNVGSFGVRAQFASGSNNSGLIAGDSYYIPVVAERKGAIRVVEIAEDLPQAMVALATSRTAKLFLTQASISIPQVRDLLADTRNWTQEDSYITINSGITTYDNGLLASGVAARLPIVSAKLFVEHRDLLQDFVNAIDSVRGADNVAAKLGVVHPDNPLAQGVYTAALNANNQPVYFVSVSSDDLAGYNKAIKIAEKSDTVYGCVPLTFDQTVKDAFVSHVDGYSTAEVGRWRVAWTAVQDTKTRVIYDLKTDGTAYKATITDDPAVSGTQYRLVTIPGAKLLDDGVRPNDTLRINFRLNSDGVLTYDELVINEVRTNTTLVLARALTSAVNSLTKVQVIRNFTRSERAANIAAVGGSYNNRRARAVFPDVFKYGGVEMSGYFAAAGLAGLRSGVVPHQGLTNTEFLGADDLSKVVLEFTQDDLDTMAAAGVWLLTQEVLGSTPYVRHQLTTDTSSLNTAEDSITTNVDSISYGLKAAIAPFIGRWNVNPENVAVIRAAIVAELINRATNTYTIRAGNQLTSFTPKDDILSLGQNSTFKDRISAKVRLNVPAPFNYLDLDLVVQ